MARKVIHSAAHAAQHTDLSLAAAQRQRGNGKLEGIQRSLGPWGHSRRGEHYTEPLRQRIFTWSTYSKIYENYKRNSTKELDAM